MKDIPGFEGRYAVTTDGRVWSHAKVTGAKGGRPHNGMWLKPQQTRSGYLSVDLKTGTRQLVHRLVLLTFVGPAPNDTSEANHKNGIKTDNHAENLEWVSSSENRAHAWRTGLIKQTAARAARCRRRRLLTPEQAASIVARVNDGANKAALAREYGVDRKTISNIAQGAYQ